MRRRKFIMKDQKNIPWNVINLWVTDEASDVGVCFNYSEFIQIRTTTSSVGRTFDLFCYLRFSGYTSIVSLMPQRLDHCGALVWTLKRTFIAAGNWAASQTFSKTESSKFFKTRSPAVAKFSLKSFCLFRLYSVTHFCINSYKRYVDILIQQQ